MRGWLATGGRLGVLVGVDITLAGVGVYADVWRQIERTGVRRGPGAVLSNVSETPPKLAGNPRDWLAPPESIGARALAKWLHLCTAPSDRVLVILGGAPGRITGSRTGAFVASNYAPTVEGAFGGTRMFHVLIRADAEASGSYRPWDLPCFERIDNITAPSTP